MEASWNEHDRPGDWRRVLVYGLGASGRAASRLLLSLGVPVVGVDGRAAEALELGDLAGDRPGEGDFELRAGAEPEALPQDLVDRVDAVVVSPGVPLERPLLEDARRRGVPVLAEVELAFPFLDGPVVAVTGSNGKSTTTALAGAMLREAGLEVSVCGNIGPPLSAQVDPARVGESRPGRVYVVELSSFQLSAVHRFHPRAAAFLNLAPDHLDRHGGVEAYAAAKRRIFENQRRFDESGDVAVVNADDPVTRETAVRSRKRLFSLRGEVADGCFARGEGTDRVVIERAPDEARGRIETELFRAADSPLPGDHNLANAMASALLARALGASADDCRRGLASFRGLPHRMERVAEAGGVTWFDDSKGTNPAATLGCLRGFADGSVHLILGGSDKGADFRELAETVAAKARRVYLIGETAPKIEAALGEAVPIVRAGTLDRAVAEAAEAARPGEAVLLSPACASFDQFHDFNHRGDEFQRTVRERLDRPDRGSPVGAGSGAGGGADG